MGEASGVEGQGSAGQPPPRRISPALLAILAASLGVALLSLLGDLPPWRSPAPAPPVEPGPHDRRLVPGQRADFIRLGLAVARVEQILGPGKIRPAEEGTLAYVFEDYGITCGVQGGRVVSVLVTTPQLRTANGIGVGSDVDAVLRTFGEGYELDKRGEDEMTLRYWAGGIHFTVRKTRVAAVMITEPVMR